MTEAGTFRDFTPSERRIWIGQQLAPDVPLYNMAMAFEIEGNIEPERFSRAFRLLAQSHDMLRSVVARRDGQPGFELLAGPPQDITLEALETGPGIDDPPVRERLEKLAATRIHLDRSPYDSRLIALGSERWVWFLNQHHLVTDVSSCELLFRRLGRIYESLKSGVEAEVDWPQAWHVLQSRRAEPADQLPDAASETNRSCPVIFAGQPGVLGYRSQRSVLDLPVAEVIERAGAWFPGALGRDVHVMAILAACAAVVLHRLSGEDSIRVGVPVHNRSTAAARETVGLMMDICVIDCDVSGDDTLQSMSRTILDQLIPKVGAMLSGRIDAAGGRGCDVIVNYLTPRFGTFAGHRARTRWIHPGFIDREHLMRLQVHDFESTGVPIVETDLNDAAFVNGRAARFRGLFRSLCGQLLEADGRRVKDLDTAPHAVKSVRAGAIEHGAQTPDTDMWSMFERQVERDPSATALVDQGRSVSFEALSARAEAVAAALGQAGVTPGQAVAFDTRRGADTVAAILGIIRAGAAFVPMDAAQPCARRRQLATQLSVFNGAPPLLLHAESVDFAEDDGFHRHSVNDLVTTANTTPPAATIDSESLCYVMFTSGTSGEPKGVQISHGAIRSYIDWAARTYVRGDALGFALFSSLSFDLTLTSLFLPLVTGNTLIIFPSGESALDTSVLDALADPRVGFLKLTPSHLAICSDDLLRRTRVSRWVLGGEDLKVHDARRIVDNAADSVEIYNEYGPTEATVGCMIHRFDPDADRGKSVPIGHAIDSAEVLVLDRYGKPVPPGIRGEIFVGGGGLARGYLNAPELTARKFRRVDGASTGRLYATGDGAVTDEAGVVHYLGRLDGQTKIHGVRVEVGEIEAAIDAQSGIASSAVIKVAPAAVRAGSDGGKCARCGLSSAVPGARLDDEGVCRLCRDYEAHGARIADYFRSEEELNALCERIPRGGGPSDCIALYSGGKDSTYMLYQLVERGLSPLVFTLDNGFISPQAKQNIERVVRDLDLEHAYGQSDSMGKIFADSLRRFSDVCNGCFKTIYTLSTQLALDRGLDTVFTGLSRGQLVETRVADLYTRDDFSPGNIDKYLLEARKLYHRMDDAVARCLDTSMFQNDDTFEKVRFVDFYRYVDVDLATLYDYLERRAPWVRPSDTGRSTNCRINDAGIFVHTLEQGFHNYARPYSWDVRLGHKTRDAALAELDDDIDPANVESMLSEIGYRSDRLDSALASREQLVAFFVSDGSPGPSDLARDLEAVLPKNLIPSRFIPVESLPLTPAGKRDDRRLQALAMQSSASVDQSQPSTDLEAAIHACWRAVFTGREFGVHTDFFELGGDSLAAVNIAMHASTAGIDIAPHLIVEHATIQELCKVLQAAGGSAHGSPGHDTGSPKGPDVAMEVDLDEDELKRLFDEFSTPGN